MVSALQKWWFWCGRQGTLKSAKKSKIRNCKHCWMNMICKYKNNSNSNWELLKKLFLIIYKRWEKFRRLIVWVPHKLNASAKTREIVLARYKKKLLLHWIVTDNEKWISFGNPKHRKSWISPGAPSTLTARPNALAGRRCSVFGGTRGAWSIISC